MAYRKSSQGRLSPATRITQEIIARLEAGTKPWVQPWRGVPVSRPLRACGIPYRGMNVFRTILYIPAVVSGVDVAVLAALLGQELSPWRVAIGLLAMNPFSPGLIARFGLAPVTVASTVNRKPLSAAARASASRR